MPSVNLAELRSRARELSGTLSDPAAFRRGVRDLMETYSHRMLRRGSSMARRGSLLAWDVPGLLLRETEAALLPAALADPAAALKSADALWPDGRLEERILAAKLAAWADDAEEVQSRLNLWLAESENPDLLYELATSTCKPIRKANPTLFRAWIREWIKNRRPALRQHGWMALGAWLEAGETDSVLAAPDLLQSGLSERDPEAIRYAAGVLKVFFTVFPAEARKWLDDLPPASILLGRGLLRIAVPSLPAEAAQAVRVRLRKPD